MYIYYVYVYYVYRYTVYVHVYYTYTVYVHMYIIHIACSSVFKPLRTPSHVFQKGCLLSWYPKVRHHRTSQQAEAAEPPLAFVEGDRWLSPQKQCPAEEQGPHTKSGGLVWDNDG